MYGQLIPQGGGDPIPLMKEKLLVGRRESCDIVLRFANVSAHHCQLTFDSGYLYVRDLGSRNGIKVNDIKVDDKRLSPGDVLSVAKHKYEVSYNPTEQGAVGPPPPDNVSREIMSESLLSRAGLQQQQDDRRPSKRYDATDMGEGQINLPGKPV
jgi:pSer/pThr/pTyr-binding forkhead associated (FHA) protein